MPVPFSGAWLSRELLHCTSSLECSLKFPRLYPPISSLKKPLCSEDLTPLTLSLRGLSEHTTEQALVFGKSSSPRWITVQGLLCGGSKHLIFKIHHSLLGTWGVRHQGPGSLVPPEILTDTLQKRCCVHFHTLSHENLGLNCFSGSGAAWAWRCGALWLHRLQTPSRSMVDFLCFPQQTSLLPAIRVCSTQLRRFVPEPILQNPAPAWTWGTFNSTLFLWWFELRERGATRLSGTLQKCFVSGCFCSESFQPLSPTSCFAPSLKCF